MITLKKKNQAKIRKLKKNKGRTQNYTLSIIHEVMQVNDIYLKYLVSIL